MRSGYVFHEIVVKFSMMLLFCSCSPQGVALPSAGEVKTLDAPMDIIPLHVRAGAIIPFQEPNVTTNSRYAVVPYMWCGLIYVSFAIPFQGRYQASVFWTILWSYCRRYA